MGKLEVRTLARERRVSVSPIRRSKNRSGIIESSVKICGECGEEYCFGESCGDIMYESFTRVTLALQQPKVKVSADTAAIIAGMNGGKRKRKKKGKRGKIGVPVKKGARMVTRGRKTGKGSNNEASKASAAGKDEADDGENRAGKVKKFKRKCSKYSKKAGHPTK